MSLARAPRAALDAARAVATVVAVRRMLAGRPIGALVERHLDAGASTGDAAGVSTGDSTGDSTTRDRAPREATPRRTPQAADLASVVGHWRAAVDRALALLPGDRGCLVRATALQRRLRRAGLDATVRIGVRRTGATLDAHAWVEVAGHPVGEPPEHVAAFAPLDGLTLR